MKGSQLLGLLLGPELAAATCRIYARDATTTPGREDSTKLQSLSPLVARLVLAQRAGVEQYHRIDLAKPAVISAINDFGIWTPLLEESRNQRNVFYVVEETPNKDAFISLPAEFRSFEVSSAPNSASFNNLLQDLRQQQQAIHNNSRGHTRDSIVQAEKNSTIEIVHTNASNFELETLRELRNDKVTIVVFSSDHKADADESTWGTYEMPNVGTQLQKRGRLLSEAPLEAEKNSKDTATPQTPNLSAKNGTVRGILPACFNTKAACESATLGCSGRGKCYLKYTDPDAKEKAANKHCYTCACIPEVKKNDRDQTVTTIWGGPACQKKDVSTQFWLIALFTVGLVSLVSFAIGTILSMGNEELPSVIGAGVSGPIKR